jgi:uncharacterized phage protein (TIGR02218 family)
MDIDGAISDDAITENDLQNGLYDHANVELFLADWANSKVVVLPLRTSWIGEIQMDGNTYKVDLRGIAQRLAQTFVQTTSLECRHAFCDTGCKLDIADFTDSYTVLDVETRDTFNLQGVVPEEPNVYQWGLATFTSGANAGVEMEVLRHYGRRIQLFLPLNNAIEVGDTLDLVYGCSKTWTQCNNYSNHVNFGGEPFLSGSDVLSRYPDDTADETETPDGIEDVWADYTDEFNELFDGEYD